MKTRRRLLTIVAVVATLALLLSVTLNIVSPGSALRDALSVGFVDTAYAAETPDYYCDGADDDVQFQAALDALPTTGGEVRILSGAYSFSSTVSRAIDGVIFSGTGKGATLSYNGSTAVLDAGSQAGWVFQNFSTDAGEVDVSSASEWKIENVWLSTTYVTFMASGDIDLGSYQIVNLGDGSASGDAVNKSQLDAKIAIPAGGSIGEILYYNGSIWTDLATGDSGEYLSWTGSSLDWVAVDVGGLYGMNVETLTGNKTLTPGTDKIYQYLDENGATRIITLATAGAKAGDRFVIRHNGAYNDSKTLQVKQNVTVLDWIYAGAIKEFIFDGTNWISGETGTGENDSKKDSLSIGYKARGYNYGVAIGADAYANTDGVAVGKGSRGDNLGVAIGRNAQGYDFSFAGGYGSAAWTHGIAIGYNTDTNQKYYSLVLGYRSETIRTAETSINIDGASGQKNNVVQGRWSGTTTDATPVEIFLGGINTERFTIRASSVLAFRMTITSRDNVADEVAMYTVVDGLVKRDASNNTTLVNCTVTTVHEDDGGWDAAVSADDTNEALVITVTGDATNPVQWVAVMDGVETHF